MIGNPTPDFSYGGNITLHFKGFDLGLILVVFMEMRSTGIGVLLNKKIQCTIIPLIILKDGHGPGTSNWVPIVDAQHTVNRVPSTYGIEDGSYFRIRNLQLRIQYNFHSRKRI